MNTLIAVAIAPFGVGDELSSEVAEVVKVIRESGLPNRTYSMFTEIEGECLVAAGGAVYINMGTLLVRENYNLAV